MTNDFCPVVFLFQILRMRDYGMRLSDQIHRYVYHSLYFE